MKTETLNIDGILVNSCCDTNGRYWIATRNGRSQFFRHRGTMTRFLKVPKGSDTREQLDAWLDAQEVTDQARIAAQQG